MKIPPELIEAAMERRGEVELYGPFIALCGGIDGHTDEHFPRYSAFLTIRNDGCRVWQNGGYKGIPAPGERFTLCIHRKHGVGTAKSHTDHLIVLLHADGNTPEEAEAKLAKYDEAERQTETC